MNPALPPEDELAKLSLYELVQLLGDVQEPAPVSYLPATPFWGWLFLVLSLLVLLFAVRCYRRWQKERYRSIAISAVREAEDSLDGGAYARRVSQILKWAALNRFDRSEIAALEGRAWLAFLSNSGAPVSFTGGAGEVLGEVKFQEKVDVDKQAVSDLACTWLRAHRGMEGKR